MDYCRFIKSNGSVIYKDIDIRNIHKPYGNDNLVNYNDYNKFEIEHIDSNTILIDNRISTNIKFYINHSKDIFLEWKKTKTGEWDWFKVDDINKQSIITIDKYIEDINTISKLPSKQLIVDAVYKCLNNKYSNHHIHIIIKNIEESYQRSIVEIKELNNYINYS